MIGAAVVLISGSTPYPGFIALLPAAGAALCIVGGDRQGVLPARLLATGPPRWFGRISYSLYLWHWPILILGAVLVGRDGLPVRVSLALLAIGVAALSTRYVEGRFRIRGPSRGSLRTLVVAVACSAAVAMTSLAASGDLTSASGSEAPLPTLGPVTAARPPLPEPVLAGPLPSDLEPTLLQAHRDNGGVMKGGCATRREETALRDCSFGDVSSATTVVLFGDSHAAMWMPAITGIGDQASWRVVPLIKPACTPVEVRVWRDELQREFRECDEWRELALDRIRELRPAIVFVGSSRNYDVIDAEGRVVSSGTSDMWLNGLVSVLGRWSRRASGSSCSATRPITPPTRWIALRPTSASRRAPFHGRRLSAALTRSLSGPRHGRPECSWLSRSTGSARTRPARWCSTTTWCTATPAT